MGSIDGYVFTTHALMGPNRYYGYFVLEPQYVGCLVAGVIW